MGAARVSTAVALALLAVIGVTVAAQPALGLEPGVHVDPGSPAAKEYALPLNQARQTGTAPTRSGSAETPFGAGIKPPRSGGPGASASRRRGARGHAAAGAQQRATARAQPTLPPAVQRAVDSPGSSGGGGSLPALVGGGIAVLVLGAFGGTVLRHSRRPTPSG